MSSFYNLHGWILSFSSQYLGSGTAHMYEHPDPSRSQIIPRKVSYMIFDITGEVLLKNKGPILDVNINRDRPVITCR